MRNAALYRSLLRRMTWRHWMGEPGQSLLLLLLLSLGVGAYFSIRLANRAAIDGFAQFHGAIQPRSDAVLRNQNGPLHEEDLRRIRHTLDPLPAQLVPVVETTALYAPNGKPPPPDYLAPSLRVVGLDLVQLGNAGRGGGDGLDRLLETSWRATGESGDGLQPLLDDPRACWISPQRAATWGLSPGDDFPLLLGDRVVELHLRGTLPRTSRRGEIPDFLVILDLPDLQKLLERPDAYDRVEIVLPEGPLRSAQRIELAERLAALPYALEEASNDRAGAEMTAAFRLNLTILSLIALLVALYLITQALDAAVVRRRSEIATLRSLGFTTAMVRRLWLLEWIVFGLCGGVGGLLLGWAMAQMTAGAISQTVNALYFGVNQPSVVVPRVSDVFLALALGMGGSLLAGWLPLRDAASTPPAQVLASGNFTAGFGIFRRHGWGFAMLGAGGLCWFLPPLDLPGGTRFPLFGYCAAFLWLIGGTLVVGLLFPVFGKILRRGERFAASFRLARSRLAEPSGRHRLAAAGLFVALAMAAAMSILVGSFAQTMEDWVAVRFRADVYASSVGMRSASGGARIRPEVWQTIATLPEVAEIDPFLLVPIRIDGIQTFLAGSDLELLDRRQGILWIDPPSRIDPRESVFVNEAFCARFAVTGGDLVRLPLPNGDTIDLQIGGVFADYGNERGTLLVDRSRLAKWWQTDEVTNFSLWLREGVDPLIFTEELRRLYPALAIRENTALRAAILRIFRQTFAVTESLKYLGIIVALVGLALAQLNLLRESRREWLTLRSLGATRHTIGLATALEGVGIALVGTVGGLLLSGALGALLIFVINRQSFGWTLQYAIPAQTLGLLAGSTLLLAGFIGYGVGRRFGHLDQFSQK